MTSRFVTLVLVLALLALATVSAQQWVTDWNTYDPQAPFEVGVCYQHPYTDRLCVLGEQVTIGKGTVLIVQVLQGTQVCRSVPSRVCGIPVDTPRGVWLPVQLEDTP